MRLGPEDRQLITLPLFHANAQYYSFMTALNAGASVALMPRFSAVAVHGAVGASRLHGYQPVRGAYPHDLAQPRTPTEGDNGLRMTIFAQNVTEAQLDEWEERFGAPLLQIYGMTETMGQPLVNALDYTRDNMSIGMPSLGYWCKVVDENGNEAPDGVPGEVLVKGEPGWTIMKGYFKDPENTAKTIQDGWLRTGDIAEVDEEGYFRFVDRAKDMIKRAGENVAAGEVEAVIKQHSSVADAAVIGVPDEMRDESGQGVCHPVGGRDGHRGRDHRLLRGAAVQVPGTRARRVPRRVPTHVRGQNPEAHPPPGRRGGPEGVASRVRRQGREQGRA